MADCVNPKYYILNEFSNKKCVVGQFIIFANFER